MAGASDKARFYLEQSVPELQELERKKIFTKQEITSIAKKRSDFEHKLNARESCPSDYVKYAEYEMNLESLRRKRTKRLGVKSTNFTGQRRVFFVLDRATRKFHGDIALWMQYISFARKQKSNQKVSDVLVRVLRLHPTKSELWIYAAKYALEEKGDMTEARGYMRRGLRLCTKNKEMWIEYARLEMIQIARFATRSKILGLKPSEIAQKSIAISDDAFDGDGQALSSTTEQLEERGLSALHVDQANEKSLEKLNSSPVSSGALPLAIFDAAMKEFNNESQLAWDFFDMFADFDVLPRQVILSHVLELLQSTSPNSPETLIRWIQQPVIGVDWTTVEFPVSLSTSLARLQGTPQRLETAKCRRTLYDLFAKWMSKYLEQDNLDEDIRTVVETTLNKTQGMALR